MNKIPVGATVGYAYRFLFGQIGAVLAATGIPALIFAGADYGARFFSAAMAEPGQPPGAAAVFVALASVFVGVFATALASVAITRIVLEREGEPVKLKFGWSVVRMTLANLRFLLGAAILLGLALAISLGAYSLAGIPLDGNAATEIQPSPGVFIAIVLSWSLFLYAFASVLRMGFLLTGAVAAEATGGLKRSHDLTQGNTWRALAISFLLGLPIAILLTMASAAIMRSALGADLPASISPQELLQRMQQAINERLLAWELFNAVIFVLYSGLVYSGIAFAYREAAKNAEWHNPR